MTARTFSHRMNTDAPLIGARFCTGHAGIDRVYLHRHATCRAEVMRRKRMKIAS